MGMRKWVTIIVLAIMILVPARANGETGGETRHVGQTLESSFLKLELNADVVVPDENVQLAIYETDYAYTDDAKWNDMFFGDPNAAAKDEMAGWDLAEHGVYRPEFDRTYSFGDVLAGYSAYEARLFVYYKEKDISTWWDFAKEGVQAEGLRATPDEAAAIAQGWADKLALKLGWNGFSMNACLTFPAAVTGIMPGTTIDPNMLETGATMPAGFYVA
jgi:hypothetical protein